MTFLERLGMFLPVTGPEQGHVAWWLSTVDWPSDADAQEFAGLMGKQVPD